MISTEYLEKIAFNTPGYSRTLVEMMQRNADPKFMDGAKSSVFYSPTKENLTPESHANHYDYINRHTDFKGLDDLSLQAQGANGKRIPLNTVETDSILRQKPRAQKMSKLQELRTRRDAINKAYDQSAKNLDNIIKETENLAKQLQTAHDTGSHELVGLGKGKTSGKSGGSLLRHLKANKGKYGIGAGLAALGAGAAYLHNKSQQKTASLVDFELAKIACQQFLEKTAAPQKHEKIDGPGAGVLTGIGGFTAGAAGGSLTVPYLKAFEPEMAEEMMGKAKPIAEGAKTQARQTLADNIFGKGKVTVMGDISKVNPKDAVTGGLRTAGPAALEVEKSRSLLNKLQPGSGDTAFAEARKLTKGSDHLVSMPERIGKDHLFFHELGHVKSREAGNLFHNIPGNIGRALSGPGMLAHLVGSAATAGVGVNNITKAKTEQEVQNATQKAKRNTNIATGLGALVQAPQLGQELEASWRGANMMSKAQGLKGLGKLKSLKTFKGVPTYALQTLSPIVGAKLTADYVTNRAAKERLADLNK